MAIITSDYRVVEIEVEDIDYNIDVIDHDEVDIDAQVAAMHLKTPEVGYDE